MKTEFTDYDTLMQQCREQFPPDKLAPRPWTHHVLMIKDATGREVLHLGGTANRSAEYLTALAGFICDCVNKMP